MPIVDGDSAAAQRFDVCIVGAGPAGLAVAFDCAAAGLATLVLESGGMTPADTAAHGHPAVIQDTSRHAPIEKVACRAFGGTSHWWGGLCNPFLETEVVEGGWPIPYAELAQWYPKAADFLGCGPDFLTPSPVDLQGKARADGVSRTSQAPRDLPLAWQRQVAAQKNLQVVLHADVVGLDHGPDNVVTGVRARIGNAAIHHFHANRTVLAAGGLGTTRLLLAERMRGASIAGGAHLGRFYMGHLTGAGARIRVPAGAEGWGVRVAPEGDQMRERLFIGTGTRGAPHCTAFWIGNTPLWDARHRSGARSAKYLIGRLMRAVKKTGTTEALDARLGLQKVSLRPHMANILRHPLSAACAVVAVVRRLIRSGLQRHPDHPEPERDGTYALWYHAEQSASERNVVEAEGPVSMDALPPITIRFGFDPADAERVVQAHLHLKDALAASGSGLWIPDFDPEELAGRVHDAAYDGYHQIGTARMATSAEAGVVDEQCRVFGLDNVHAVSAAVFPTSGQPNPTLTVVALARRLAAHIVAETGRRAGG